MTAARTQHLLNFLLNWIFQGEEIVFWTKSSSQWGHNLTLRAIECWKIIQRTYLKSENVETVYRHRNQVPVMVWAVVYKTCKFPLISIKQEMKMNTNSIFWCQHFVKLYKYHFKDDDFRFHPSHTSNKTQTGYQSHFQGRKGWKYHKKAVRFNRMFQREV